MVCSSISQTKEARIILDKVSATLFLIFTQMLVQSGMVL